MVTSVILLVFLASFTFYNTSKKAKLSMTTLIERWIQQYTNYARLIGGLLLFTALILSINNFGITSGIIFWLVILMSLLSLIIIISPLKKVNYKHLVFVFFILLIFEFIL